jgi:hypothetical protein
MRKILFAAFILLASNLLAGENPDFMRWQHILELKYIEVGSQKIDLEFDATNADVMLITEYDELVLVISYNEGVQHLYARDDGQSVEWAEELLADEDPMIWKSICQCSPDGWSVVKRWTEG